MAKDDLSRVRHAVDACKKLLKFTRDKSRESLDSDEILTLAIVHLLEVIGEAAQGVSSGFQETHPDIPWKKMIAMRNRLIHGYFAINLDIVWDTVLHDIPPVLEGMENILEINELASRGYL